MRNFIVVRFDPAFDVFGLKGRMERAGYNPNEVVHGKWGGWEYTGTGADGVFSDGRYPSRGEYPPATIRLPSGQLFDFDFERI